MKGVVFTEFLELVEDKFGDEVADKIIDESDLPSGGVYTAVGTYDHGEIVQLVTKLSEHTGVAVPDLLKVYGHHLFSVFLQGYPALFEGHSCTFDVLANVEGFIHVEVRKLYPDASLPTFDHRALDDGSFEMIYKSDKAMADFAEGLMAGCADHFGETIVIQQEDQSNGSGTQVRFHLVKS